MVRGGKTNAKIKEPIILCICGMAGSGKSTLAKELAKKYHLDYYSGGDALKALAEEEGYKTVEHGWWESREGMHFIEERKRDPRFDEAVDRKLTERARRGNVVLDSWTMPWLLKKGFKIWLEASTEKRAKRIAKRDGMPLKEALNALRSKEEQTKAIYKRLYGFGLGEDFKPFHLILDTDSLTGREVFQVLCEVMDNVILSSVLSNDT
jgi:cytidylate kinase